MLESEQHRVRTIVLGLIGGIITFLLLFTFVGYLLGHALWDRGQQTPSWAIVPPTPTRAVTPLPPNQPTPTPTGKFSIGEKIRIVAQSRVRLRATPGYRDKLPDDVLTTMASGSNLIVLSGPELVDGLTWWKVNYEGTEGWVAESTSNGVQLLGK